MEKVEKNPVIVKVEKEGRTKFKGMSTAKSFRTWLIGKMGSFSRKGDQTHEFMIKEILNAYNRFHPETVGVMKVPEWKGKSSITILKNLNGLTIIKFQRPDKHAEPEEMKTEVSKDELIALIDAIKNLNKGEQIKTSLLAMEYSKLNGMNHSGWNTGDNPFFSDRKTHNKYTLMLQALAEEGLILYKGGNTTLLNREIKLDDVL